MPVRIVPVPAYIIQQVAALKPGQRLSVSIRELPDGYEYNGAVFTPADRVMENIVGSCWTHSYFYDDRVRAVTFVRHEDTGQRRYTSPDRR